MTIIELEDYIGSVQIKMTGSQNHSIACKLAGIRSIVEDGFSEMTAMIVAIEKTKKDINLLLKGISVNKYKGKSKEYGKYLLPIGD